MCTNFKGGVKCVHNVDLDDIINLCACHTRCKNVTFHHVDSRNFFIDNVEIKQARNTPKRHECIIFGQNQGL